MHRIILPMALLAAFATSTSMAPAGGRGTKSDSVVKTNARVESNKGGRTVILVLLDIDKGWHLYANPVGNEDMQANEVTVSVSSKTKPQAVKIEYPAGQVKQDKIIGKHSIY